MPLLFVGSEVLTKTKALARSRGTISNLRERPRRPPRPATARCATRRSRPAPKSDPVCRREHACSAAPAITGVSPSTGRTSTPSSEAPGRHRGDTAAARQPDAIVDVTYPSATTTPGFGEGNPSKNTGSSSSSSLNRSGSRSAETGEERRAGRARHAQMAIHGLSKSWDRSRATAGGPEQPGEDRGRARRRRRRHVQSDRLLPRRENPRRRRALGSIVKTPPRRGEATSRSWSHASCRRPDRSASRRDSTGRRRSSTPTRSNLIVPSARHVNASPLEMKGLVTTPLDERGDATYEATATLKNFKVNLFGFIILWFDDLSFAARKGRSRTSRSTCTPTDAIMFGGPLEFVNELKIHPVERLHRPARASRSRRAGSAGYSLNAAVDRGRHLRAEEPLARRRIQPALRRDARVREVQLRRAPASVLADRLAAGGGGFFAIGVSSHGVREIEAAIEFGAAVSINLGVAVGSVEIKAGVYFHWPDGAEQGVGRTLGLRAAARRAVRARPHLRLTHLQPAARLPARRAADGGVRRGDADDRDRGRLRQLQRVGDVPQGVRRRPERDPKFIELIPDDRPGPSTAGHSRRRLRRWPSSRCCGRCCRTA